MQGFFWRVECLACGWWTQSVKTEVERAVKEHKERCPKK